MSGHGGVARSTQPRTEEQRRIDLDKISHYRDLENQVRKKTSQKDYSQETLDLTSKLLRLNPEYYTIWNIRRRCITYGFSSGQSGGSHLPKESQTSSPKTTPPLSSATSLSASSAKTLSSLELQTAGKSGTTAEADKGYKEDREVIKTELTFTVPLLMEFPKCYWIWSHRLWALNQSIERLPVPVARKVWEEELGLVGKLLHRDSRNFHAWGYRRYVVEKLESAQLDGSSRAESEFEYTTKMIHNDLSNFSAWHHRSQIIPRLLNERKATDDDRRKFLESELSLIREGLNVGPEDQSLWFYHQFLVSNITDKPNSRTIAPNLTDAERRLYVEREIDEIKDFLEDYQDIKWIYEALVQYSIALPPSQDGAQDNSDDWVPWLKKLRELDPQRSGRWNDLGK
ncbi:geranylgeranyl transferase type-2 subunit alpha [Geosmithia morbida]|uniref:Geranylgeranyl transferase type-2 subunit alpha n=1 Tax=Geosmithia morbida TaxID=1094350 RepID=A0A9P5D8X4_9HYPO|nr:geranylgeranyl transferase type-2 subunit alpha [Geosmithia morbida]KAF4125944.1 geranylgeranyl transferase type-2 subunit alpha [Geosmithia morbida]